MVIDDVDMVIDDVDMVIDDVDMVIDDVDMVIDDVDMVIDDVDMVIDDVDNISIDLHVRMFMMQKMKKQAPNPNEKNPTSELIQLFQGINNDDAYRLIPSVPEDYRPLDTKKSLRKIPAEQSAEVDQAMEQLWEKRQQVAEDLGASLAPDAERGHRLFERMLAAREVNRRVHVLSAYTEDQEALANDQVIGYLNEIAADIEHMATKKPQIAATYDKVLKVLNQRRRAIIEGKARARELKGLKEDEPEKE